MGSDPGQRGQRRQFIAVPDQLLDQDGDDVRQFRFDARRVRGHIGKPRVCLRVRGANADKVAQELLVAGFAS